FTFGCLSDLHSQQGLINGSVENVRLRGTITNTLNAMKSEENLDLIVLGGDYTSDCSIPQANWQKSKDLLMNATRSAFVAGAKTPVIYVDGNHEYEVANFDNIPKQYNSGEYYTTPMRHDIGSLLATDCFYETAGNDPLAPVSLLVAYHYVVKGFDFVVLNTGKNFFKSAWDYSYSNESVQWCANKLAEIYASDPDKTVFFMIHIPFSDSNSISNMNKGLKAGEAANLLKTTLSKYHNLIMLYGHDHGTDKAYLRTSTDQRVTRYNTNGDKMTELPASTSYYIQNYKNTNEYLAYDPNANMGVTATKTAGTVAASSILNGTFYISFSGGANAANYLHCGSSGRFSGNSSLSTNSSLYTYKVVDPLATKIVANKVSKIENDGHYVFVSLSTAGGYYMLTDEIYASGASQRIVGLKVSSDIPGAQITFTPSGSYSPIWKLTDATIPVPIDVTYSLKNYNTSKYLGFDTWNITTKVEKSICEFTESTVTPGAFLLNIEGAPTGNPYLYCGSSGRFSGNRDATLPNSQVELFKVNDPKATTIIGTKVTSLKAGETYLLVEKRSEGYYMLTNEMYKSGTSDQRMIGQAVSISNGTITYTQGASSALWAVEANLPPVATPSFFSSFMGSMRYYNNSIEGDVGINNSKIVQALMVYVYSDRVELKMKNYGESGTFGSIIINKELTPYVSYRNVKHSEEYKTDVPAFDGETGGKFKVNTPINVRVKSPDWISVYYTTDGSAPTEKSAKVNNGIITWTP
ncbi:MAG: metallophosphoesterase, partial [Bacteroidales bacterium]